MLAAGADSMALQLRLKMADIPTIPESKLLLRMCGRDPAANVAAAAAAGSSWLHCAARIMMPQSCIDVLLQVLYATQYGCTRRSG
eukprot:SAG11_NODE_21192_length_430_cov_0.652568_2_plen_84_part_01